MRKVDWSKAPEGAEFWAADRFCKVTGGKVMFWDEIVWRESQGSFERCKTMPDFQYRPTKEWPTETRIDNIGRNRTEDDMGHYDEQRESHYAKSGAREQELAEKLAAKEASLKQAADQARPHQVRGEYDRKIKGKYNTGTCTVDVYRVLSAFEIIEPELQHCIKKLLAAGQRGAKDYQQDLREASVSLCMLIDRLQE